MAKEEGGRGFEGVRGFAGRKDMPRKNLLIFNVMGFYVQRHISELI